MISRGGRQGERHGRQAVALRRSLAAAGDLVRGEHRAGGFTLIEMLVVMIIIGILSSLALGVMYAATERARHSRTESLIRKLHVEMMERVAAFETRRLPIVMDPSIDASLEHFARRELVARREVMRMELPDNYSDVKLLNVAPREFRYFAVYSIPGTSETTPVNRPARLLAYLRRIEAAETALMSRRSDLATREDAFEAMRAQHQSAEMLYLVATMPSDGGQPLRVPESYIGDVDDDGMPEFIDGWGRPIEWIRWPVGYVNQADSWAANALNTDGYTDQGTWGYVSDFQTGDRFGDPDPMNWRGLGASTAAKASGPDVYWAPDPRWIESGAMPPALRTDFDFGYRTVPLIVSGGSDGVIGLRFGWDHPANTASEPYWWYHPRQAAEHQSVEYQQKGTPRRYSFATQSADDELGEWVHFDNITNHLLEVR